MKTLSVILLLFLAMNTVLRITTRAATRPRLLAQPRALFFARINPRRRSRMTVADLFRIVVLFFLITSIFLVQIDGTPTLREGWNSGEHEVIYPALKWILNNLPRCERYAYVGYFMNDVQVPSDFGMDPEIQDLLNQCHELQRQFVEAHKAGLGGTPV